jgi:hypothetical protein
MSSLARLKILQRIAQTAAVQPTTTTPPATSIPAAPKFNAVSGPWAWITQYYNPNTVRTLSSLLAMVSTALHYASQGKFNLQINQSNLGSIDPSASGSTDAKNLILLAKLFYSTFLHNGQPFPKAPTAVMIQGWIGQLIQNQALLNLNQLNPTGQAAQKMQLDGSLYQNIVNSLNYLKMYNQSDGQ